VAFFFLQEKKLINLEEISRFFLLLKTGKNLTKRQSSSGGGGLGQTGERREE